MYQIFMITKFLGIFMFLTVSVYAQDFSEDPVNGRHIYERSCMRCHGQNGDGNGEEGAYLIVKPADFHSPESIMKTNSDLFSTIKYGVVYSPMHGWADRLTDQDIMDVIAYIRLLAPFQAVASK
ncbi:c-type cytochrome [Candidatus Nitrospira salsa]